MNVDGGVDVDSDVVPMLIMTLTFTASHEFSVPHGRDSLNRG